MGIPVDKLLNALKLGVSVQGDADTPIRVAVFVDVSSTPSLIQTVREAFIPQTTSALLRVERLGADPVAIKPDSDVALILSCGSEHLQARAQEIVVAGVPTVVLAESSVEVPFIQEDTRMLGLIAATDKTYLLDTLARWILDRTEKATAFALNFPFMRIAAANRAIISTSLGNMATGALFFVPGADFPLMTTAQLGMMLQLAAMYGKPVRLERGYEAAAVLAAAFALRGGARVLARQAGHASFAVKALIGGLGTYGMGRALCAFYDRDVDYTRVNELVGEAASRVKHAAADALGTHDVRETSITPTNQ